jgi:hypothetical protein
LQVEGPGQQTLRMSPSQERSKRGHQVLEAESVVCSRRLAQKGFNLAKPKFSQ